MGLFRKQQAQTAVVNERPTWMREGVSVSISEGNERLEVVGESYYQDSIWQVVGGRSQERIRRDVVAVLVPEPDNQYDPNAISVWIGGLKVGHLSRGDAVRFTSGLYAMSHREGSPVGMYGTIAGGGQRSDGIGMLGVFLRYNPEDFGFPPTPHATAPQMLTGELEVAAGGRHLLWLNELRGDTLAAIKQLRVLLGAEGDPIERHFMFCELEGRLYRSRDAFASAVAEYDAVIRQHDAEMETIRAMLIADLGQMPVLETYKQAAIRHQKAKDFAGALWWAQRGLALYGSECCRPEAVEDLQQRAAKYEAKLTVPASKPQRPRVVESTPASADPVLETLSCQTCGCDFERARSRGRKPLQCPDCRDVSGGALRTSEP